MVLDLSNAVIYSGGSYSNGSIVPTNSWVTFTYGLALDPTLWYRIEVDVAGPVNSDVWLYSASAPTVEGVDNSSWNTLGSGRATVENGTVVLTIGSGIQDWALAVADGERYLIFESQYTVTAVRVETTVLEVGTRTVTIPLGGITGSPGNFESNYHGTGPFTDGPGPQPTGPGDFQVAYQHDQYPSYSQWIQTFGPVPASSMPAPGTVTSMRVVLEMDCYLSDLFTYYWETESGNNYDDDPLEWALVQATMGGARADSTASDPVGLSEFRTADLTPASASFDAPMFNLQRTIQYQDVISSQWDRVINFATTTGLRSIVRLLIGPLYTYSPSGFWTPWGSGGIVQVTDMRLRIETTGAFEPVVIFEPEIIGQEGGTRRRFNSWW